MASTCAVSMAMKPLARASQKNTQQTTTNIFFNPLPSRLAVTVPKAAAAGKFQVRASLKEKAVTGLTAAALTASLIVPDVAEAAVSPSLKNFLLSIGAGGVVLAALVGAIIGVANFDPVKRG